MHPAKVPHPVLARRQHVLQIAPQELVRIEGAFLGLLRRRVAVAERYGFVVGGEDALVADGGVLDVAGEVADDVFAGAGGLDVHPPAFPPDRVGDLCVQVRGGGP
jgi:hypothetical protein